MREKLIVNNSVKKAATDGPQQSKVEDPNIEDDDMLLDLLGGMSTSESASSGMNNNEMQSGQSRRQKKWGKKGRKGRNKDPYGCHSTPDQTLGGSNEKNYGVMVNGGKKHQRKNYTRATGYGTARAFG